VLALQDQALVQEGRRIARALALIRAARAQLRRGQTLSIDDLATLSKETSMPKLTRATLFHPALVPHQHKHFTPEEIEAFSNREDFDQEQDIAVWQGLITDLIKLTQAGDPASPASMDLARRWLAHTETFTKGDHALTAKLRNMVLDAFADPVTAPQMPYSEEHLLFLGEIFQNFKRARQPA